jgi:hypothetical protein
MSANGKPTVTELMRDTEGIDRAIRRGVQEALRIHKLLGHPIAVGRPDGSVEWIKPEDIEVDDENDSPPKLPDHMIP